MSDEEKPTLRERLVARKTTEELLRARENARRKHWYTQEDFEHAGRWADELAELFKELENESPHNRSPQV